MFQIIFHGVRGANYQENDSPSWFNPAEGLQVANYFSAILQTGLVTDKDQVGIIAPYRQQASKMRQILKSLDLPVPKIGSVEEFQGQEKDVIMVTTVRSLDHEANAYDDSWRGLGFMQSKKRFNVAITRAMSLLIVVGDPHLLSRDPSWFEFIKHCLQLGAYVGCDLPIELC